jgi:hypothetical protein
MHRQCVSDSSQSALGQWLGPHWRETALLGTVPFVRSYLDVCISLLSGFQGLSHRNV